MGGFKIYQDNYADFTIVSNRFIDEYMEDANDAQLKVYLYLIRMLSADLSTSVSDIADRFNYTEKDVIRSLHYWEKKKVISLEFDSAKNLVGVCMLPINGSAPSGTVVEHPSARSMTDLNRPSGADVSAAQQQSTTAMVIPISDQTGRSSSETASTDKPSYSKDDIKSFSSRESSAQLVFIAEQYLQKTLSAAEMGTLIYLSETLHFSDDLIDYLLQYCVEHDKKDHRYIEAVALDWAKSGVTTPRQAASHSRKYDKIVYEIMRALGKSSSPSNIEISFINKWTHEYAYDMNVIGVACERTVLNTDKKRFNYADSILTRWHEAGVNSKSDIEAMDSTRKVKPQRPSGSGETNKFNQHSQNTYDYATLEKELLSN